MARDIIPSVELNFGDTSNSFDRRVLMLDHIFCCFPSLRLASTMASSSSNGPAASVLFSTQTKYPLPSQNFMIPASWKRYQLSQLINKALSLDKPVPFDFLVRGEILRGSLTEWCSENGVGEVFDYLLILEGSVL